MDFYVVISEKDSMNYFPNNVSTDFRVHTPNTSLRGRWYVGISEISIEVERGCELLVLSDICSDTLVRGDKRPLLKRMRLQQGRNDVVFPRVVYIPVIVTDSHSIRVFLEGDSPPKPGVTLVLHFKKYPFI